MLQAGHVLINDRGQLVSIDQGFCAIMQADQEAMVGRLVLDLTAPADRAECGAAIANLLATRKPFRISKRFLRDDGTLVWVVNSVSMVEGNDGPDMIVATIDPIDTAEERRAPARLLECARLLVACRDDRAAVLDAGLIADMAWDVVLAAYVAEAEGRTIDVTALASLLGVQPARATRWIDVLLRQDVIEIETREASAVSPKAFRLTAAAHSRLETHLVKVSRLRDIASRQGDYIPEL